MQKKHSGKMGVIALPVALIAAAVGVLLWMLTGAQGYLAAADGQTQTGSATSATW